MFLQLQAGGSTHLTTATLRASHSTWHTAPWTFAAHWRPRGPGKHVGETARATARFDLSLASPEIRGRTADGTEVQRKSASNVASALQTALASSQTTATGRSLVCKVIMDLPLLRFKQGPTLPDLAEAPSPFSLPPLRRQDWRLLEQMACRKTSNAFAVRRPLPTVILRKHITGSSPTLVYEVDWRSG